MPIDLNLSISENEYIEIRDLVYAKSGIWLGENKKGLVKARLAKRIRTFNFKSFKEYQQFILKEENSDELIEVINAISTNVTSFFREPEHFQLLEQVILPEIVERKSKAGQKKIRIWSAACSSGEEVYTILMILREYFRDDHSWDIRVLGTDISTKVLGIAKKGCYDQEKIKDLPVHLRKKYFNKFYDDGREIYSVSEEIKKMATFARFNLMDEKFAFQSKLDIIFCRNAMIYFDLESRKCLVKKIFDSIDKIGYFFIGHSESLIGLPSDFKIVSPAVYKKIL